MLLKKKTYIQFLLTINRSNKINKIKEIKEILYYYWIDYLTVNIIILKCFIFIWNWYITILHMYASISPQVLNRWGHLCFCIHDYGHHPSTPALIILTLFHTLLSVWNLFSCGCPICPLPIIHGCHRETMLFKCSDFS